MAVEMVNEGLITPDDALARVTPAQLEQLLHPRFGPDAPDALTTGLAASPGAAVGRVVLSAEEAVEVARDGTPVVLVREETSPDDLEGMVASKGLLTSRGGLVSHASVHGAPVPHTTATMIETPRAALRAAAIAPLVDAFSFGTNDLSQLTFGFSRDDVSANYIPAALAGGMLEHDPFRTLDVNGVARLIEVAVTEGRAARPDLVTGICGEHGGDPESIAICHRLGLDHVSCSASRIEVARLAAARAALGIGGPSTSAWTALPGPRPVLHRGGIGRAGVAGRP